MASEYEFGGVRLDLSLGSQPRIERSADDPFQIAILGDFGGVRAVGNKQSGAFSHERAPVAIDRDNFDEVLAGFGVELEIPVAGRISFKRLDDFHPDRLYERVPLFEPLRQALSDMKVASSCSGKARYRCQRPPIRRRWQAAFWKTLFKLPRFGQTRQVPATLCAPGSANELFHT